jgi:hypothetical protein
MRGPTPKPAALRQRTNRVAGAATLPTEAETASNTVPDLPAREKSTEIWHKRVLEWWASVWRSPMSKEYLSADMRGGLFDLAELRHRLYTETDTKIIVALVAEIRQQDIRFGLSPIDRRRLQWEVAKGEEAEEKTKRIRKSRKLDRVARGDPRDVLSVVK